MRLSDTRRLRDAAGFYDPAHRSGILQSITKRGDAEDDAPQENGKPQVEQLHANDEDRQIPRAA